MKTKFRLLAMALIAGGTMLAAPRVSIGVGIGGYGYPAPAYAQAQPPCPGPGYVWVDGNWAPEGGRNVRIDDYWRPPAVTVAPPVVEPHLRSTSSSPRFGGESISTGIVRRGRMDGAGYLRQSHGLVRQEWHEPVSAR